VNRDFFGAGQGCVREVSVLETVNCGGTVDFGSAFPILTNFFTPYGYIVESISIPVTYFVETTERNNFIVGLWRFTD
jgi:hypothetical protein